VPPELPELSLPSNAPPGDAPALPLDPVARLRALWGRGFLLPFLPTGYLALLFFAHGDLRPEHVGLAVTGLVFGLWGRRTAAFYRDILPFMLVGLGYDSVRYARALWVGPERVLGCQMQRADAALFSIGGVTLPDWFGSHHLPALDLLASVPYACFIYIALAYAVWLWLSDRARMRRFLWAFAIANAISFTTWIVLPAAPPWYIAAHGCNIDMSVVPSAAGLVRVDQLLGIDYFSRFYTRAASVYGALPSMHCAYPVLGMLTAWPGARRAARAPHVVYTLWMASAAVYLQHHWVIDVLAGWATAAAGVLLASRIAGQTPQPAGEVATGAGA